MKETENTPTISQRAELFWEKHKKTIIIGTGIVASGALIALGIYSYKNTKAKIPALIPNAPNKHIQTEKTAITTARDSVASSIIDTVSEIIEEREPKIVPVIGHPRKLNSNQHASPEKLQYARLNGISLGEHMTWVNPHTRKCA